MAKQKKKVSRKKVKTESLPSDELAVVADQFAKRKILVVGDVGVDRYTIGSVDRVSPEAPVPIVWVREEKHKLGLAANVADNIHSLGGKVLLCGVIGKDRSGDDFRELLKETGIDSRFLIVDRGMRTVLKERVVSDRQQLLRIDYESGAPVSKQSEKALLKRVLEQIPKVDGLILEDYAKGMLSASVVAKIFKACAKYGVFAAADPNMRTPLAFYRGATLLTPNQGEAEALTGIAIDSPRGLDLCGRKLLEETDARYVIITRGKDGMAIFEKDQPKCQIIPTMAREVYDVSGAGDTVISVLTLAMASGVNVVQAATYANLAAGIVVGKRGTATVSVEEVLREAEQQ